MKDKVFVDSNIWLYLFDKDESKKQVALKLLGQNCSISTQVISENINVCRRKLKLSYEQTKEHARILMQYCEINLILSSTIELALQITSQYGFSYYDSQILAAIFLHKS